MKTDFLGGISQEEFLRTYWNKRPLLIKGAVKKTSSFATFDDFFELSKDADFETRIVYESGGDYPWQAKSGPFKAKDFKKNALWTLICHNLELLNTDFYSLKQNVNFIADWNFDDIMATVSKEGASVGAHIDDYSVFILQGRGKRKWLLQENPNHEYHPDLDIRLLKNFNPTLEWILEPGDMIYIPPSVAHHGISLSDSISYSIGFKSIRYKDLLDSYVTELMSSLEEASFRDLKTSLAKDRFKIEEYIVDEVHAEILNFLKDRGRFKKSLQNYLSRPKNEINNDSELSEEEIMDLIQNGSKLQRDIWAKLVMSECNEKNVFISISSNTFKVSIETYELIRHLFELEASTEFKIKKIDLKNEEFIKYLILFIQNGVFYFS